CPCCEPLDHPYSRFHAAFPGSLTRNHGYLFLTYGTPFQIGGPTSGRPPLNRHRIASVSRRLKRPEPFATSVPRAISLCASIPKAISKIPVAAQFGEWQPDE